MTAEIISIPRTALHEQVANRLRQMLVEGSIAPGAKLNERELSEVLNVSRTPLREAIKMLAAEGLVELLPNRGAIAVELTEADVRNTFEVMAGLEDVYKRQVLKRGSSSSSVRCISVHSCTHSFWLLAPITK